MTSPLAASCVDCGVDLPPSATECSSCGCPAGTARRRVVVVLFADLAGYTALCSSRDPEDVHLLVRPLMNRLRLCCERNGGIVPIIEGDGFMAVFGAVRSSEVDPELAVDAARAMQELAARELGRPDAEVSGLHVGMHVGEVLVAPSWEACGLSFSGDAVNVARRLSGLAAAGEVVGSAAVAALTPGAGWGEARREVLRGRPGEVSFATLDWDADRAAPAEGTATPWVSRPELEDRLAAAVAAGAVVVVGDAGMGKSRLVRQLAHRLDRPVRVLSAGLRGLSWAELGRELGADPGPWSALAEVLPPSQAREAQVKALRGALAAAPERLVVVDDVQWFDPEDRQALADLALDAGQPSLVLVSREPPPELTGLPQLDVSGLRPVEADALVDHLLPGASDELRDFLRRRCGGVPLFLEQCAALLLEDGAVVIENGVIRVADQERLVRVPTSMRLYVAGRVDALDAATRAVLEVAAVLGPAPDRDLLEHLAPRAHTALEVLTTRGILVVGPDRGPGGRRDLRFAHALVRDVVYESTLRSRRADLHRAAAEWYAVLPVAGVLESQAHHLEAAATLGAGDCELVRSAVAAMVTYARSIQLERPRVASGVLRRADDLVRAHPGCDVDRSLLDLTRAGTLVLLGESQEGLALARAAGATARRLGDRGREAEALLSQGRAEALLGVGDAPASFGRAAELYEELGDETRAALVAVEAATLRDADEGISAYLQAQERAYRSAMRTGDGRVQALAAQQLAVHAWAEGEHALTLWAQHARDSSRADDVVLGPRLELAAASVALYALDGATAHTRAERSLTTAQESGVSHVVANATIVSALGALLVGNLTAARRRLEPPEEALAGRRSGVTRLHLDTVLCRVLLREGRGAEAFALMTELLQHPLAADTSNVRDLEETQAWLCLESGWFERAAGHAAAALRVDEAMGTPLPALQCRLLGVMARSARRGYVPLGEGRFLIDEARRRGAPVVEGLASRFLALDDALRGHAWTPTEHVRGDVVELAALDVELEALSTRQVDRLLDAADLWAGLGSTVWRLRALCWWEGLTGGRHPDSARLVQQLAGPEGLAEQLRAQVAGLAP